MPIHFKYMLLISSKFIYAPKICEGNQGLKF